MNYENIELEFKNLNKKRKITIYKNENQKYEKVIYFHDNQNLWFETKDSFGGSWNLEKTIKENKFLQNYLFVGIDNGKEERLNEYSLWLSEYDFKEFDSVIANKLDNIRNYGANGKDYINDLVQTVLPYVENKYCKKNPKRFLIGSSMGGVINIGAGLMYPEVFSYLGCLSNAFWFAPEQIKALIKTRSNFPKRIYMSCGTKESEEDIYLQENISIYNLLKEKSNTVYHEIENGIHHESCWEVEVVNMIQYLDEV